MEFWLGGGFFFAFLTLRLLKVTEELRKRYRVSQQRPLNEGTVFLQETINFINFNTFQPKEEVT